MKGMGIFMMLGAIGTEVVLNAGHVLAGQPPSLHPIEDLAASSICGLVGAGVDHLRSPYYPRSSYFDTAYGSSKRDFEYWHGPGSWERNR